MEQRQGPDVTLVHGRDAGVAAEGRAGADAQLARARAEARQRKARLALLAPLFGRASTVHHIWDLLLELLIAHREARSLSVSGAAYSAGLPVTTTLRYLGQLEGCGLVGRSHDPDDGRRIWMALTVEGQALMAEAFG